MAKQDTLFPLEGPKLDPDTVRRVRAMLEDTDDLTCKISISVVHETSGGTKNKYSATLEVPGEFVAALLDVSEAGHDFNAFADMVRRGEVSVTAG